MRRSRFGMIAGLAGAALATWWWRRRGGAARASAASSKGEVIYDNHPIPSSEGIL